MAAINGFDSFGHYLRAGLIVNQCSVYAIDPTPGCTAKFAQRGDGDDRRRDRPARRRCCAAPPTRSPARSAASRRRPSAAHADARDGQAARAPRGCSPRRRRRRRRRRPRRPRRRRRPATAPAAAATPVPTPERHAGAGGSGRRPLRLPVRDRTRDEGPLRRRGHRGQPRPDRRGHRAGAARGRASSPTTPTRACRSCPPTRSRPRCRARPTWCAATRCASAARASARSTRSPRAGATTARASPCSRSSSSATPAPLPKDSTLLIRSKSALGLKYVELTRGSSSDGFRDGDTMPLTAATPAPVEFDEFTNMFDDKTREAMRTNLEGFGDAFAGRGVSINTAIVALRPLLRDVVPVARNLSDPDTQLEALRLHARRDGGDRRARGRDAGRAVRQPRHDDGRAARGRAARTSRTRSPAGARRSTRRSGRSPSSGRSCSTPRGCSASCAPACARCARSAPILADALEVGTPTLRRSVALNRRLEPLLRELQDFANDPIVPRGIDALDDVVRTLNPTLQHLAPGPAAVQLRDAVVPQRLLAAQRGRQERHLAALHHHRHAAGAQQRGRAGRRRPPTGRRPTTTCTPTRIRTPRRPASRASARRPTSPTRAARP